MIIVKPELVTEGTLFASNVPETDYPLWISGTNYIVGDRRIYMHRIYEVIQAVTGAPNNTTTPNSLPAYWLDIGATNRYRLFDKVVNAQTTNPDSIDITLRLGAVANGFAIFSIDGTTLQVTVTDPIDGLVYDTTVELVDLSAITGYYAYFFEPVGARRTDYILLDLPIYPSADIRVIVSNPGNTAAAGEIAIGAQTMIGTSNYGTQIGIRDYSRKEFDDFGNLVIVERRFSKTCDFAVTLETANISAVQRYLAKIRATSCVFVGDVLRDETIIYGFYRDFQTVIGAPTISDCTLQVEGLT